MKEEWRGARPPKDKPHIFRPVKVTWNQSAHITILSPAPYGLYTHWGYNAPLKLSHSVRCRNPERCRWCERQAALWTGWILAWNHVSHSVCMVGMNERLYAKLRLPLRDEMSIRGIRVEVMRLAPRKNAALTVAYTQQPPLNPLLPEPDILPSLENLFRGDFDPPTIGGPDHAESNPCLE